MTGPILWQRQNIIVWIFRLCDDGSPRSTTGFRLRELRLRFMVLMRRCCITGCERRYGFYERDSPERPLLAYSVAARRHRRAQDNVCFKLPGGLANSNRTRYLVDLTPLMALALISNVAYLHLPQMRSYLSRHVGFHTYMCISQVGIMRLYIDLITF